MNESEHPGGPAKGDEAPDEGEPRTIGDGRTVYPALGPNAELVDDKESQARRPEEDTDPSEEEMDGDSERGGTPPGTSTRGA